VILSTTTFSRRLDLRWRRTSYTDITSASHEAWVGSEPEQPLLADEPAGLTPVSPGAGEDVDPALQVPSLLGAMPVGVHVGTFVHRVLEASDFAAADLELELTLAVAAVQGRRAVDIGDPAAVVTGLRAMLETPLGPVLGGRRLRDVARADRLDELAFELPLAGGDRPTGWLSLSRIAAVLREHLEPGDPLSTYADRLQDARLRQSVRGYLTGSLDLVIRIETEPGPRFAVLDYKTNWLGDPAQPLTAFHYRPAAIVAEMHRHHYALQALLYTVALHRYLRWRLRGYEPARDLAGVVYLFVRGMSGPQTPAVDGTPCGVFGWRPPGELVQALSDALDQGRAS
jgi:exodeoxyribonuclease V beta subunit